MSYEISNDGGHKEQLNTSKRIVMTVLIFQKQSQLLLQDYCIKHIMKT